jgi:hypothetical protein
MGANAQTTVPTFTAGQVLTADQQNQSARTGVPVFATTVERDAAFGGTGEKTLAEGQLCYLEDSNVVQYYDGAAWATVGPASAGGLVFIAGAAFTTASSVNLPNDTFSSTYRNYIVQIDVTAVSTSLNVLMQGRTAGTTDTASVYYWANQLLSYVPTETNVGSTAAATSCRILTTQQGGGISLTLYAPQVSTEPFRYTGLYIDDYSGTSAAIGGTTANNDKQYDALTLSTSTGTMTGVYRVYGLADS